jgi:hypothetical protein
MRFIVMRHARTTIPMVFPRAIGFDLPDATLNLVATVDHELRDFTPYNSVRMISRIEIVIVVVMFELDRCWSTKPWTLIYFKGATCASHDSCDPNTFTRNSFEKIRAA